jgi:hypothetical protein
MNRLVIEYALEGRQPGYRFRPPTDGVGEETLRHIWRQAMPRGQGWGADAFSGARSLKCFTLPDRRVVASVVQVLDGTDEIGRRGVRRADITLMSPAAYFAFVESLLEAYPAQALDAAARQFGVYLWRRLIDRIVPRLKARQQVILAHPYTGVEAWQAVEVLVLRLVTSRAIRMIEGWERVTPFTTLALDWREESRIVAMPLDAARQSDAPAILLP